MSEFLPVELGKPMWTIEVSAVVGLADGETEERVLALGDELALDLGRSLEARGLRIVGGPYSATSNTPIAPDGTPVVPVTSKAPQTPQDATVVADGTSDALTSESAPPPAARVPGGL